MTAYSNNIPQSTDRPSDSQPLILSNFQALKVYLDRNHVAIVDPTTNTSEGKHKFLQMPEQAAAPTVAANEGGLYTKEANSRATLFWRQESNGTEIQLTRQDPVLGTTGESFLPGGIIIKWGISNVFNNSDAVTVTYGGTAFTTIYQVVAVLSVGSAASATRQFSVDTVGTTSFIGRVNSSIPAASNVRVRWMAIGV